ncbi:MAG TPA: cell division protein ZapE [Beijerinckiaceae bacterium]|jgi:cell division protein ZapE
MDARHASFVSRPVSARCKALVAAGTIERDPAQVAAALKLDGLINALEAHRLARRPSGLGWLLGQRPAAETPRGVYIWGSVGRGKTMLMDLFHEAAPLASKRRTHFHMFMADVHERIHDWRQKLKRGEVKGDDPIAPVAAALAAEAKLLCFDEFAVTDIADAMILGRLFKALFEHGVVVVSTSNLAPDDQYREGLNRTLFLPFIDLIKERMEVVHLEARTDYRLEKIGESPVYYVPADEAARAAMDDMFARLTGGVAPRSVRLMVHGHPVEVPAQAMGVARLSYDDLCRQPLGASDYLALARAYHTILLEGVPVIPASYRDEAKRFITLVDVFYERRVKLIVSADAEPQDLYRAETGREAFEFNRTVSRLAEMRSREYLARPRGRGGEVTGNITGIVET